MPRAQKTAPCTCGFGAAWTRSVDQFCAISEGQLVRLLLQEFAIARVLTTRSHHQRPLRSWLLAPARVKARSSSSCKTGQRLGAVLCSAVLKTKRD